MTDTLADRLQAALGPDYTLDRELGGAGMSRVFVATERALNRRVVVKVLPPDLAAGVNKERFRREIQLAAQLQHPHVVPLLSAGERGDLLWFTMPFIEGESLRAVLDRRGRLPVREVMHILHDVVDALAYAHTRGVVHRDIKPGNILMSGSHAVVTDFGVAKALSASTPLAGHTTSGMAIGTPAYMAPEQLAADPAADHRVDIYAIGLLAYELLTGTSPFSGNSPQATLAAQLTVRPTAPNITRPDIPAPLSDVVMQCLEKDAERRPQTADVLLTLLDRAGDEMTGEFISQGSTRRQRGLLAVFVVLLVATGAYAVSRGRGGESATAARPGDSLGAAVAPETVVVYKDVPIGGDEARGVPLQVVLTPAESLAIVENFRNRAGGATGRTPFNRDSLVALVSRQVADSMQRVIARMETALEALPKQQALQQLVAQAFSTSGAIPVPPGTSPEALGTLGRPPEPPAPRTSADSARLRADRAQRERAEAGVPLMAPPPEGTRRLAIVPLLNRTRDTTYNAFGRALLDSIDAALQGSPGRLEIISADATTRLFGHTPGRATGVGFALRANFVLSGAYFLRHDSLVVVTVLTDVQGGTETRAKDVVVPAAEAASATSDAAVWVRARLDSMRRADFRRAREARQARLRESGDN